jgi:hypothetical protein
MATDMFGMPTPTEASVTSFSPATGTATTFNPDDSKSTVAGQLTGLLNTNSPYMQQAKTAAQQQSASRGLLNSSMAATAGHSAAINAALPIAQADATAYNNIGTYNTGVQNDMLKTNLAAANNALQFNANASNDISKANAELASRYDLAEVDSATKLQMADIEAGYKSLEAANTATYNMYQQAQKNITDISMSKDLDAAAKQTAISNQLTMLKNGMSILGAMDNMNLGDLLNFSASGGVISSADGAVAAPSTGTSTTPSTTTSTLSAPSDWDSITGPGGAIMKFLEPSDSELTSAYNAYTSNGGTLNATDWYNLVYK